MKWHNLASEEVLSKLNSSRSGLSEAKAKELLHRYGPNELKEKKKAPVILVFARQFLSPLVYVLFAAAVIKFIVGGLLDGAVILAVLIIMATIGFIQETRAEKAMEALMHLAAPKSKVRRDGQIRLLPASDIVPGDIVIFEAGDKIPADGRLIESSNLYISEATLTGESMPVDKHTDAINTAVTITERKNLVYMGTAVTNGRGSAVVVSTGMETEIGRIATAIQETKPGKTPLQKSISQLGTYIILLVLGACILLVVAGILEGIGWLDIFLLAVAAAVSAIPEGLPAVVTVVLAVGMRFMARRNAIIRKLVAVETLGSATVICSDKTGTLTLNEMTARRIYVDDRWIDISGEGYKPEGEFLHQGKRLDVANQSTLRLLLTAGVLCNDALLVGEERCCDIIGDPTDGALVVAAAKAQMNKEILERKSPRLAEMAFQSEKRYMATLHIEGDRRLIYVKGAPEQLLSISKHIMKNGNQTHLDKIENERIVEAIGSMAKDALRVIAIGYAHYSSEISDLKDEYFKGNLTFVGLVGMTDPPRQDAIEAVKLCKQAGIKVVMITGDNKLTAEAVAKQISLPEGKAITGNELQEMSDDELARQVKDASVFARIEPLHKLRIVNAFKLNGHTVAMTGDGVNDAPALKAANIGIAMGINGTDVAKEASDMVLTDDNFSSIVAAVEEGRAIFNRLRNVILFLLTTGMGELLLLIISVAFLGKSPLVPLQIIWVNLVTGTVMAVPLGLEPRTGYELKQPPRHPKVGLVFTGLLLRIVFLASMLSIGVFMVFNWAQGRASLEEARSVAFCAVVVFEWFVAFNARSDERTIFQLGITHNRWLLIAILIAIPLQLIVLYIPFFQRVFDTIPLSYSEWGLAFLPGASVFIMETVRKLIAPRLFSSGKWQPMNKRL